MCISIGQLTDVYLITIVPSDGVGCIIAFLFFIFISLQLHVHCSFVAVAATAPPPTLTWKTKKL